MTSLRLYLVAQSLGRHVRTLGTGLSESRGMQKQALNGIGSVVLGDAIPVVVTLHKRVRRLLERSFSFY